MARPRPKSVTTAWAKTLTCKKPARMAKMPIEPKMDKPPTISGIKAATTEPKTTSSNSPTSGKAARSAREISAAMPASRASATAVAPATSTSREVSVNASWMTRKSLSVCSSSPASPIAMKAVSPASFKRLGFWVSK